MGILEPSAMKAVLLRYVILLLTAFVPGGGNLARLADWLIDPKPFIAKATLSTDAREIVPENGLVRRVIRLRPDAATVVFDHPMSGPRHAWS